MEERLSKYYFNLYKFVFAYIGDKKKTEEILEETFTLACTHYRRIRKKESEWLFRFARYLLFKRICKSRENGDDIEKIYRLPEEFNLEIARKVVDECEKIIKRW